VFATPAHADLSDYGIESVTASLSTSQAGDHPDFVTTIKLKTDPSGTPDEAGNRPPYARTKDLVVDLPPGLIGNPNTVAQCTNLQFSTALSGGGGCPQDSQVGVTVVRLFGLNKTLSEPIFNLQPPSGDGNTVARLAFWGYVYPVYINVRVRSESDYGLTATLKAVPSAVGLISADTTLWAVPASPSHDKQRLTALEAGPGGKSESPPRASGLTPQPFMTNPTSCGEPLQIDFATSSYALPDRVSTVSAPLPAITGCGLLDFDPSLSVTPTSSEAAAPTGLDAELSLRQNEAVDGLATSQLRDSVVTLPQGMTIAAGAADGLAACSAEEVGIGSEGPAACPDAARIGSAEFEVPALSRTLQGRIYQRTPEPGNLFRIWLVADDLGVHVKIGGEVHPDPASGQLTSVFLDTPQVPLSELRLHFKGGPRGVLANPLSCDTYLTHSEFTPWSSAVARSGDSPMTVDQSCDTGGFAPRLAAGTIGPAGGSFSPFVLDLTRAAGEQNVADLDVTLPPGLLAKLAGVRLCLPPATENGDCDPASRIGATAVATGPGPAPLWIPQPGKDPTAIYLAGPYKGAPYSLVVKTPAQAGPFDLGTVVVRAAIYVDPLSAQVTIKSDPLPQILEGVPVTYRTIHVGVDRSDFVLNPTNCRPLSVDALVTSTAGAAARTSSRFQATNCAHLGFKPKIHLTLMGGTHRADDEGLRATLTYPEGTGYANIARAAVTLPHAAFLAQNHIRTVCTRVQFAADQCPAGSIYGKATATSPLLDQPLGGAVYLRSSDNPLPDLVVKLRGPESQPIEVDLAGRTDSVKGALRNTFDVVPDAPVSKFALQLFGGNRGLIELSTDDYCAKKHRATVNLGAQNGMRRILHPVVRNAHCQKQAEAERHRDAAAFGLAAAF
jgi:hypothetical protein